jgi:hypothetical protein
MNVSGQLHAPHDLLLLDKPLYPLNGRLCSLKSWAGPGGVEENQKWNFSHPTHSHFCKVWSLYCKVIPGVSLKNYVMTKVSWENVLLMKRYFWLSDG